jgi:hypothetical protein
MSGTRPSYYGAPEPKDDRSRLFVPRNTNRTPRVSEVESTQVDYVRKPSEISPLLMDALREAKETENIANQTMEVVEQQGETIDATSGLVRGVREMSSTAVNHLKQLQAKVASKKICLWGFIMGLFVLNIILVITMIYNHGHLYYTQH